MPLLRKIRTIAAAIESTIGTAETLSASDAQFNAYDIDIQGDIAVQAREGQGGFNRLPGVAGKRGGSMTFKTDVEWDGTSTLPDWATVLLPLCGYVNSSGVFTQRSEGPGSNVKTGTLAVYENGLKKTLAGAVGNARWMNPSGERSSIEWSFQGVWQAVADTAILAPTYPADTIIRYASATTTLGGTALCVTNTNLDFGNNIHLRECASTAAGFVSGIITDAYPSVEINPESDLVANDDHYGDWLAGTEAALSIVLDGPSSSDITISVPKAQIFNIQEGDRGGLQEDQITLQANKNGATQDQAVSITFNDA